MYETGDKMHLTWDDTFIPGTTEHSGSAQQDGWEWSKMPSISPSGKEGHTQDIDTCSGQDRLSRSVPSIGYVTDLRDASFTEMKVDLNDMLQDASTHYEIPEVTDCASDEVPPNAESRTGSKILKLPDLVSMWKYLLSKDYSDNRLTLYSALNRFRRQGVLSYLVGFKVLNRVINRDACEFTGVKFWKIDRENFYADVEVKLTLESPNGQRVWKGVLVCWCSFESDFSITVEELTEKTNREGMMMLNPFLVPYMTNQQMDAFAEQIWIENGMPEAVNDPNQRKADILAGKLGLDIHYADVYEHNGCRSILFFEESYLRVGVDRVIKHPDETQEIIKTSAPSDVRIPANSIVVNTNMVNRNYCAFEIFHECIHYLLHYAFYRLQNMISNDPRKIKVVEVKAEEGKKLTDPIYFMEKQADRGAYGQMMPASDMREGVKVELGKARDYKNVGEMFEIAGKALSSQLHLPHFRIRARMIQIGYVEARGALNYVNKKLITPFSFDSDAWEENEVTFVLSKNEVRYLQRTSPEFNELIVSGKYIYADGHVVRNDPRFVRQKGLEMYLTDEAAKRINVCCLRFTRTYIQKNVGEYTLGRMYRDENYIKMSRFYLEDIMNRKQLDELDAEQDYKENFPRTFVKAFDMLMKKNGETRETIAPKLHMTDRTLHDWLYNPRRYITADFVVGISLMWQLPDWIVKMLLDRAFIHLSEYDRRDRALKHILKVEWDQGIDAANNYLVSLELEPLAI